MKILMVYPECPETFWSFKYALKFISKKALTPPLGLLTIGSLLPKEWEKRVIDMNVSKLTSPDIKWADFVFISSMSSQRESLEKVIKKCNAHNVKIVGGGPLFTAEHDKYIDKVDHLVLNEAEITLPLFIEDLDKEVAKKVYSTTEFPDISKSPPPDYRLINIKKYAEMSLQYSRGCPFNCEFCDITSLFGHKVRTKTTSQVIDELDILYSLNWKGSVFFVDDNFIGDKKVLKNDLLPAIASWMKRREYPFSFNTEVSINLSDDNKLMELMVKAGFHNVFVGIETPNEESLAECNKVQNKNRDLLSSVKKIQDAGMQVMGGFIVGFDNDSTSIFQRQIDFIQKSGIVSAMVGLLNAPTNTRLYKRLKRENRLLKSSSGNNTDYSLNFIPKMNSKVLVNGYKRILHDIYSCKPYYNRVKNFLKDFEYTNGTTDSIDLNRIIAFLKSIILLGVINRGRFQYWKLLFWCIFNVPKNFPLAIKYAIYGYHYRKIFSISG
jgi:radical SAM superfamily enzyme YgiQ (UPF0313 family)